MKDVETKIPILIMYGEEDERITLTQEVVFFQNNDWAHSY